MLLVRATSLPRLSNPLFFRVQQLNSIGDSLYTNTTSGYSLWCDSYLIHSRGTADASGGVEMRAGGYYHD